MNNTDSLVELITRKILEHSGIHVSYAQIPSLISYIEKKASAANVSPMEFCERLSPDNPSFDDIINLVTVNETYFFREEKQFDFLKEEVFPKFIGRNLTVWSCCCATGEEPISLLALALSMGINLTIYASDIDDNALKTLHDGHYSVFSLRTDGKKYHELLEPYSKRTESQIIFDREFLDRIQTFKFNLVQDTNLPFFENVDIVFMRNVFIYFDKETRISVTKKIAGRLKDGGYLFFSMNEIGSVDKTVIPSSLYKTNSNQVYYFVRGCPDKSVQHLEEEAVKSNAEKMSLEAKKQEKLRLEVAKAKNRITSANSASAASNAKNNSKTSVQTHARPEPVFDVKRTYDDICSEINSGNFIKARTIARAISGSNYKKYSFFLQGYIEYHADNRAAAETFFASAETLSPDFWPAFFYHGIILRDMEKTEQAAVCFSKCKNLLANSKNKTKYDFALDSFSPAYIDSLCETFLQGSVR